MASSQENVQPQQKMHMGWELSMAVGRSLPDRCSATERSRLGGLLGEGGDLGEIIFLYCQWKVFLSYAFFCGPE